MSDQSWIGAFRELVAAKEESSRLDKAHTEAVDKAKRLDEALRARMRAEGIKTLDLELGAPYGRKRFTRTKRVDPKILNEKALIEDLKARGLIDELTRPTARMKALKQYVRTLAEEGHPAPAGMDISDTEYISVTSVKTRR